jgi:uncharacterized membrane protein HdeD (DUF308 family)
MTKLDEFLDPLQHGVWEVVVPKESVTEPLDAGWVKSPINVPSPGTIASYRKGQYHSHEQQTEWHVHLDNYDPKVHPYLHLVDDAPLLLMIGDTIVTLIAGSRKKTGTEKEILEDQKRSWKEQILVGILLLLVGIFIAANPLFTFESIFHLLIPLAIIVLGIISSWHGIKFSPFKVLPGGLFYRGIGIIIAGIIAFYLPLNLWMMVILGILAIWMFASAIVLFVRASKGRAAIPEGFASRLIIAILSIVLVILIFLNPLGILEMLLVLVGIIAFLLGLMLLVNGIRLRNRMIQK